MKALITGIEGFVGPYLAAHLEEKCIETYGTYLSSEAPQENWIRMDVTDPKNVFDAINKVKPDLIFHLAGFSSVGASFKNPELCKKINVEGTRNLLDAARNTNKKIRILIVSSAEVYGRKEDLPNKEDDELEPLSPYSESRIQQEKLCKEFAEKNNMFIIITRSFNHTGPKQTEVFAIPSFAKQIVMIEMGRQDVLKVGNLDAIRDFSDVRDVVKAYVLLLEKGQNKETYNIGSGISISIRQMLEKLIEKSSVDIKVEQNPERMRPADIPKQCADITKIKSLGWKPEIDIDNTLSDIMRYWRKNLNK